ncbi:MAG: cold shock domain-containing protein [Phycisphaerales bacterium]|nr:cold shock domain-containing protein [Phycisphaerales bacterium]
MSESEQKILNSEGTVKWFDARKGFGFIVGPQGQDIFVHFSVIDQEQGFRTLRDSERVIYSAESGAKGWAATHAKALARTPAPAV